MIEAIGDNGSDRGRLVSEISFSKMCGQRDKKSVKEAKQHLRRKRTQTHESHPFIHIKTINIIPTTIPFPEKIQKR